MILTQALGEAAARGSGQPAFLEGTRSTSYRDFRESIGRLSNLYQTELEPGMRVAILAQNSVSFAQSFFALSNSGNPCVLLSPSDTEESWARDLRDLDVKSLFVTGDLASRAREFLRRERLTLNLVEMEKRRAGEYDAVFQSLPDRPLKDTDPVLFVRTGEEGGERLFVKFNHKQIQAACQAIKRFYRLTPNDRLLTTMSWSHPFALTHGLLLPLFNAATCVVDPQLVEVEEFVEYIAQQRISRFVGPPKFYFQLLSFCAARKYPLPGVKSITVGMGSLSLALRKTYQLLKIPVLRCFGRPEAVWSIAMDDVEEALDIEKTRSKPVAGMRVMVCNPDGEEIPGPGRREGLLSVMSDTITTTYWHPDNNKAQRKAGESFRGTWLKTGEVARLEGENDEVRVAVLGRADNMLNHEGVYLSARKIDEAASGLDGVADAAGFVRLDKKKEATFAVAIAPAGKKLSEKEVLSKLQERLPPEYRPQTVHLIDSIPRDAFDSVNRLALQKQFSG